MKTLGEHLLIDYYGCDAEILNSHTLVKEHLVAAAKLAKATIVQEVIHRFNPHGISGVIVIAESHIAIHTWPEYNCAAVDVFTCGDTLQIEQICSYLQTAFRAQRFTMKQVSRGADQ